MAVTHTHKQAQVTNKSSIKIKFTKYKLLELSWHVKMFIDFSAKTKLGQTKLKAVSAFTCKSIEFKKKKRKKRRKE